MLACRMWGHRHRFVAQGTVMRWTCERGCGAGGEKPYPTAADASRYARALDRSDEESLGRRAPYLGLFPLRLWYWFRRRRAQGSDS
ncbi:MAG: hypothetical protein ACRDWE_06275 [Acidimicrobiales bacterium]